MINIITRHPKEIAKYIGEVGLAQHQVGFNLRSGDITVLVGGRGVRNTHCYVQSDNVIQCLDPRTVRKEPMNRVFILCALHKALLLAEGKELGPEVNIRVAENATDVLDFLTQVSLSSSELSVDIECTTDTQELTCIGLAYKTDIIYSLVVPFAKYTGQSTISYWSENDEINIWHMIAQWLGDEDIPKVFQNFIFDTMILSKHGVEVKGKIFDTMIAAHLVQPELPKSLEDLARLYLMCEPWKNLGHYNPTDDLFKYCARDAGYTLALHHLLNDMLAEKNLLVFYKDHLCALTTEVLDMCERGWTPDTEAIRRMKDEIQPEIDSLLSDLGNIANPILPPKEVYTYKRGKKKADATYCVGVGDPIRYVEKTNKKKEKVLSSASYDQYQVVDLPEDLVWLRDFDLPLFERVIETRDFNPRSPEHVKDAIAGLGFAIPTHMGKETTDELALKKMQYKTKHPFFDKMLDHRRLSKMMSSYCNVLLDDDGKLRFSVNIAGTVTGRFSSRKTAWNTGWNAQNTPKRFRHISLPSMADGVILNVDFKQADPHLVAWLSGEEEMLRILQDPQGDLHAHTAKLIYGHEVGKDSRERKVGKACNNGLNYGMGVNRFMETCRKEGLILSYEEANNIHKAYFEAYPRIKEWQESIENTLAKKRALRTPFGRERYFYGHWSYKLVQDALAYIPPTTVADALNVAWLNFVALAASEQVDARVLQQCHDSLKLECARKDVPIVAQLLRQAFASVFFTIKDRVCNLPIDIECGPNWGELRPLEKLCFQNYKL